MRDTDAGGRCGVRWAVLRWESAVHGRRADLRVRARRSDRGLVSIVWASIGRNRGDSDREGLQEREQDGVSVWGRAGECGGKLCHTKHGDLCGTAACGGGGEGGSRVWECADVSIIEPSVLHVLEGATPAYRASERGTNQRRIRSRAHGP